MRFKKQSSHFCTRTCSLPKRCRCRHLTSTTSHVTYTHVNVKHHPNHVQSDITRVYSKIIRYTRHKNFKWFFKRFYNMIHSFSFTHESFPWFIYYLSFQDNYSFIFFYYIGNHNSWDILTWIRFFTYCFKLIRSNLLTLFPHVITFSSHDVKGLLCNSRE